MLHDVPRRHDAALVAHPDDAIGELAGEASAVTPANAGRRLRSRRGKVVRPSALGMLLRPIGISIGVVL